MANEYHVTVSEGPGAPPKAYTVTTDKHHANYDDASFRQHLLDVIKGAVPSLVAGLILHEYQLRRPLPK